MSRRRRLSGEEEALWTGVTRSIKPLRARPLAKAAAELAVETAPPITKKPASATLKAPVPREAPLEKTGAPPVPLGRRLKRRVARGREPIGNRLDLHGLTQAQAHTALLHFLQQAQADGAKMVLVVTGKGIGKGRDRDQDPREHGVLKRQVPLWLALPQFRPLVVGFEDAHLAHGGEGALYVRLRRPR
jgi:DNA-nicking Smr family endonuclease